MKKLLLLLLLPLFVCACTENEQFVTLSDSDVSMHYDETKQLSASYSSDKLEAETFSYKSSDPSIVTVSKTGLVSGVSLGTATVTISSSDGKYTDECEFTITPKSNLYVEPYTVFGSTVATVKSKESRTLFGETTESLVYTDTNTNVSNVMYVFSNDASISAMVTLIQSPTVGTESTTFLMERYEFIGTAMFMFVFEDRKTGNGIMLSIDAFAGISIVYVPSDEASYVKIKEELKASRSI